MRYTTSMMPGSTETEAVQRESEKLTYYQKLDIMMPFNGGFQLKLFILEKMQHKATFLFFTLIALTLA